MLRQPIVWLCLADGEHAKILTPRQDGRGYAVVSEFASIEAHKLSRALGADRPSRVQESASSARHAIAPRRDLHAANKAEFMRLLANYLDLADTRGECDAIELVAPSYCLRLLRDALKATTLSKVRRTAAKDLMKIPLAKLPTGLLAEAAR